MISVKMVTKLPKITYKIPGIGKRRCTVDFKLGELRCKTNKGLKFVKFTDMPENKNSKIKKKLRGIRFRTYGQDYIGGLDD